MKASEILQMAIDKGFYQGGNASNSKKRFMCIAVSCMHKENPNLVSKADVKEVENVIGSLIGTADTLFGFLWEHARTDLGKTFDKFPNSAYMAFWRCFINNLKKAGN